MKRSTRVHLFDRAPGIALCAPTNPLTTRITRDLDQVTCRNCRTKRRALDDFLRKTRAS